MKREEFIRRWPNFKPEEFACKCGECGPESGLKMKPSTMEKLQNARTDLGFPFVINSAYRCPNHKEERKKSKPGTHANGEAVDVKVSGKRAIELLNAAPVYGFTGLGVHQRGDYAARFIHLDDAEEKHGQPRPHIWSY